MSENVVEVATAVEVPTSSVRGAIESLNQGQASLWSSLPAESFDEKRHVLAVMTNAESLADADMIGKPFNLANLIVHSVEMVDEKTGALSEQPRVLLVTDEGKAYSAISSGLMRSLENITGMFGHPSTWESPIPVEVVEKRSRAGYRFYTLNIL